MVLLSDAMIGILREVTTGFNGVDRDEINNWKWPF